MATSGVLMDPPRSSLSGPHAHITAIPIHSLLSSQLLISFSLLLVLGGITIASLIVCVESQSQSFSMSSGAPTQIINCGL